MVNQQQMPSLTLNNGYFLLKESHVYLLFLYFMEEWQVEFLQLIWGKWEFRDWTYGLCENSGLTLINRTDTY